MRKTKRQKVELWLLKNKDIINGTGMDKRLDFPRGTIQKFLKYNRSLNVKRIDAIYKFLKEIGIDKYNNSYKSKSY
ncbi:hypothetical protein ACSTS3_14480 [Aquimarina muelleri]|uniref:hypothetical protein n=1 Tax=Aquimarina muelleri TaxID=279356 RepID=UPI003F688163